MDIHAPDKPIHSWREFAVHIAIVTIGILIALSLEGIREAVHDHHLVKETRENFQRELKDAGKEDREELRRVHASNLALQQLVADLPALARDQPAQIAERLKAVDNPNYFFTGYSWQAAASTGAFAHISPAELERYADAFESIRIYTQYQNATVEAQNRATAYFDARPHLTPAELSEGIERVLALARAEKVMDGVGHGLNEALAAASK